MTDEETLRDLLIRLSNALCTCGVSDMLISRIEMPGGGRAEDVYITPVNAAATLFEPNPVMRVTGQRERRRRVIVSTVPKGVL